MRPLGGAAKWWLAHSPTALAADLAAIGGRLDILKGPAEPTILRLAEASGASRVFWTRRYGASEIAVDGRVKAALTKQASRRAASTASCCANPGRCDQGRRVVPRLFGRSGGARERSAPARPDRRADGDCARRHGRRGRRNAGHRRTHFTPQKAGLVGRPARDLDARRTGRQGETRAFLADGAARYAAGATGRPGGTTSRLSPHLRFGEISPRRVAADDRERRRRRRGPRAPPKNFSAELAGANSPTALLYAFPVSRRETGSTASTLSLRRRPMPAFAAWTRGRTGYPIVDAGMRELWRTGYMHNRVRMIAASFLVKHSFRLAARRTMVLGHAVRRRPGEQSRELAVGGRVRRRRRALFPHFQSGAAGAEVRPGGRLRPALGSRTRRDRRPRPSTRPGWRGR